MSFETDNFIHLVNPDHPEEDFRKDNKGEVNIVGTTNFGAGIQARMGLLKGSGKPAPAIFLFSKPKWESDSASGWMAKYKGSKFCTECVEEFEQIEEFEQDKEIWLNARVSRLDEEFDDERVLVGVDVPDDQDIPVRDLHSKGYHEIVGLTNKEMIHFNKNGDMMVKWKITSPRIEKLVRSAKHPLKLFQYSPELSNPVRDGNKRSGILSGIAVTEDPAWSGSGTTEIFFEKLKEGSIPDEGNGDVSPGNKGGKNMADKETMELQLEIKDLKNEKEKFESQLKESNDKVEAFEKEKETFEKKIETLTTERDDYKEKFESKEKDYNDLKSDNDANVAKIEKFETNIKEGHATEVFELGLKIGRYTEDKKEDTLKELFGLSEDRLAQKKEDYEFFASQKQKTVLGGTPAGKEDGNSAKSAFNELF